MRKQSKALSAAAESALPEGTELDTGKDSILPARLQLTEEDYAIDLAMKRWAFLKLIYDQADATADGSQGRVS